MFIGHFAAAFAAKRLAPRSSLATLVVAAQWPDILWPVFVLLGWERVAIAPGDTAVTPLRFESYPISHSLAMGLVWAALLAAVSFSRERRLRDAAVIGALVISHWLLDFASHRPDMPLWPGGPRFGLGLWNSVPATVVVEGALFAGSVASYAGITRALDPVGRWAFLALAGLLLVLYVANLTAPPPPSVAALAVTAVAAVPLLWWLARWADGHRAAS